MPEQEPKTDLNRAWEDIDTSGIPGLIAYIKEHGAPQNRDKIQTDNLVTPHSSKIASPDGNYDPFFE